MGTARRSYRDVSLSSRWEPSDVMATGKVKDTILYCKIGSPFNCR